MYTEKTFQGLVFATNFAWAVGVVNYRFVKLTKGKGTHKGKNKKFDSNDYRLEMASQPSRYRLLKVTFFIILFYSVFIAFRVVQKTIGSDDSQESSAQSLGFLVKMAYLFTAYALPVVLQFTVFLKPVEVPRFMEEYLKFYKIMKVKYLLQGQKGAMCRKFFGTFLVVGFLVDLQNIAILRLKPEQLHLFTSVLDDPKHASKLLLLPLVIFQIFIWVSIWANIFNLCFHWFTYITCSLYLFKELDANVRRPRTDSILRDPQTAVKTLRVMQLLHRFWEVAFQHWMCPGHKAILVTLATFAIYGVLKLSGPRAVIMGFVAGIALLYISVLFYKFGQLYERSRKAIQSWKSCLGSSRWMRKFIRSIPNCGVMIGSFYVIDRTTVANVLSAIINNTITLLFI